MRTLLSNLEAGGARAPDRRPVHIFSIRTDDFATADDEHQEANVSYPADDRRSHTALSGTVHQGTRPACTGTVWQRGAIHLRPGKTN